MKVHLDGRCMKVHVTTDLNILTETLNSDHISLRVHSDAHSVPF